ncbi:MAG: nucleoside 2-deoxyribosyltransferase domain-containing protein [Gemmataceae bacterium]|nr:nucleoside 2-deoxyribosyltransferase domain-containing protein [Gemmataceae bacterium]
MARVIKPPAPLDLAPGERSVFLAGSIEMGRAEPWQAVAEQALADLPVAILNPRRDEWDASWEQSMADARFAGQVAWELEALERASLIAMHFAPATQAPVTLLELGLWARSGKLLVSCPPGYWRRGNVEMVCDRYGAPLFSGLDDLLRAVSGRLGAG